MGFAATRLSTIFLIARRMVPRRVPFSLPTDYRLAFTGCPLGLSFFEGVRNS